MTRTHMILFALFSLFVLTGNTGGSCTPVPVDTPVEQDCTSDADCDEGYICLREQVAMGSNEAGDGWDPIYAMYGECIINSCESDSDCSMEMGCNVVSGTCESRAPSCINPYDGSYLLNGTPCFYGDRSWEEFGHCSNGECVTEAECNPGDLVSASGLYCRSGEWTPYPESYDYCLSQEECSESQWGSYCNDMELWGSGEPGECHECTQSDSDLDGIHDGCSAEYPHCSWGIVTISTPEEGQVNRSHYYCE